MNIKPNITAVQKRGVHTHMQTYTVKTLGLLQPYFGHLSCMPVVYVTRYMLQTSKDACNLIQSVAS